MRGAGPVMRSTTGSRGLVLLFTVLLAAGCGTASTPAPSPLASVEPAGTTPAATAAQGLGAPTPAPTQSPGATPTPAYAEALRIGWDPSPGWALYGFRGALEGQDWHQLDLGKVVFGGLYWYDASFAAVPDLADGPCLPQGDGTVIRCHLIETTFQDGTPVTADDVAYTYRLFSQPAFSGGNAAPSSWFPNLTAVQVVDARTVDFVLPSVDSAFMSTGLATPILARHAVESAYAAFTTAMKGHTAAELTGLADTIDAGMSEDPPVCGSHLDEAASLISRMGVPLYREDFSRDGTFDACGWVGVASWLIRMAAASLGTTGLAAVAAAYADLRVDWEPVGTGPYRFVSQDADGIRVEAWPGYHGGMAATRYIDFVPAKGDGSDLLDGSLDIDQMGNLASLTSLGPGFQATAAAHGLRVATLPEYGFYALQYNVRPGLLFADLALRKAMQLCIDLARDVDAATGGAGAPAYGSIMPGTWAWDPTLPKPSRDVTAARALIEGAGWHARHRRRLREGRDPPRRRHLRARRCARPGQDDRPDRRPSGRLRHGPAQPADGLRPAGQPRAGVPAPHPGHLDAGRRGPRRVDRGARRSRLGAGELPLDQHHGRGASRRQRRSTLTTGPGSRTRLSTG